MCWYRGDLSTGIEDYMKYWGLTHSKCVRAWKFVECRKQLSECIDGVISRHAELQGDIQNTVQGERGAG